MTDAIDTPHEHTGGTSASWYRGWDLTEERREFFRQSSVRSHKAKLRSLQVEVEQSPSRVPRLDPIELMPAVRRHDLPALSLFSGGGGLDLGFERAGYQHLASYDTLTPSGETLRANRPGWAVHSGANGDVRRVDWRPYRGEVAVLHGGPPCQPFSAAGRQQGDEDERNMLPEFVRAVCEAQPLAFVAENVAALAGPKFAPYLSEHFLRPLSQEYQVVTLRIAAPDFGVPQLRRRVFFIGFRGAQAGRRFQEPPPTHRTDHLLNGYQARATMTELALTMGVREALGLPSIGKDALAPTIRSTLTGPRHTTSILNSATAQQTWAGIEVWPNGVAPSRIAARRFATQNGHVRLAVADCAVLQGFPSSWRFTGPTYMALGQIGNSVAPPVAYHVARAVAEALDLG